MDRTLFYNGNIYTMNKEQPKVEAVVIKDNKIEFAGELAKANVLAGEAAKKYDLKGKMLLPGFIDSHCHPTFCAFYGSGVQLDVDMEKPDMLKEIEQFISDNPERKSYFGLGYAEWKFDEKGPQKEELDRICRDKPIMILGSGAHEAWCNSKAFEIAEITSKTPDPIPDFHYFQRDEEGNPSGQVVEMGAQALIFAAIDFFDPEIIKKNYIEVFKDYASMGVTSLADCGAYDFMEGLSLPFFKDYFSKDTYYQRISASVLVAEKADKDAAIVELQRRKAKYHTDAYKIDTYKLILDGTIESRSAAMMEPYEEDGSNADPLFEGKEIEEVFLAAAKEGFDINCHAIGDKAIHECLRGAKAVREAGYKDIRIINSHTEHVLEADRPRFAEYDVVANTTGVWHYGNPTMYKIVGKRAEEQFRLKPIVDLGARMSLGSDRPVDEYGAEPLKSIQVAMTRQLYGQPDGPVLPPANEVLTLQDCLEGYTCNAAYAMHMDEYVGTIEAGKYADFVILAKDLFDVDKYEIYKIPIIQTMVNGRVTYCGGSGC